MASSEVSSMRGGGGGDRDGLLMSGFGDRNDGGGGSDSRAVSAVSAAARGSCRSFRDDKFVIFV